MNPKELILPMALIALLPMTSCSGLKNKTCTDCTATPTVIVTLYDTPPTGVTLLSFSLPIAGISLSPSSGSPISIYSPTSLIPTELTRLQTDSALIVTAAKVPVDTYTSINVTVAASSGVFINANPNQATITGTNASCAYGNVCNLPTGAATTVNIPLKLTVTNQNQWIGLDVNLNNAIITTNYTVSVDFMQPNVFTATTTPRVGIPTGAVDTIEDFTGKVTGLTIGSIMVQSGMTGQSITAVINSNTQFDSAPADYSKCASAESCVSVGSIVSLDAQLASSGTLTATEIDTLDAIATDEVEGILYAASNINAVAMILADRESATGKGPLAASEITYGTQVVLTASPSAVYVIDAKTLSSVPPFIGFSGSGDLRAGQQVRVQVSDVTSSPAGLSATADNMALRFSRISGIIGSVTGNNFTLTGYPAYIGLLNPLLGQSPFVFTYPLDTIFDGVTGTGDSKFVTGASVAVRALYLNNFQPPFAAAKVRVP
jgi:Domain of unknown function (DUF5666)